MQGLMVETKQFGVLPWWDAALAWLKPEDRQAVYRAKRTSNWLDGSVGDRHQLIQLPWGPALYDETNEDYSADKFPPLDWTTDYSKLVALVDEVFNAGFVPVVFLGGDNGEVGYQIAQKQIPDVVAALGQQRMNQLMIMPGWDGVFYGYSPDHVVAFGQHFRQLAPNGHLGIEMSEGHIPLGEGSSDWTPTGRMKDYDSLFVEFSPNNLHQDSTWQISGRLLGPSVYKRPSDQPAGDDPNPPMYLLGTPRGRQFAIPFEYDTFPWVRGLPVDAVKQHQQYLFSIGWNL